MYACGACVLPLASELKNEFLNSDPSSHGVDIEVRGEPAYVHGGFGKKEAKLKLRQKQSRLAKLKDIIIYILYIVVCPLESNFLLRLSFKGWIFAVSNSGHRGVIISVIKCIEPYSDE